VGQNGISQIDPTPKWGWFSRDDNMQDAEEKKYDDI